ncbi:MAG: hypothetical protein HQM14_17325 [SAR324 cluster bacterium]|nr:hypothetical protein [SAR324 cluster bacterium]
MRKPFVFVILKIISISAFAIIIIVLGAELALKVHWKYKAERAKDYSQNNIFTAKPAHEVYDQSLWEIPWLKYKPNASLKMALPNGDLYRVDINSHGFRTKEFLVEKKKGSIRIISIGGSTTVQGMTNDQTYPAILETELSKKLPHVDVEVLNFGISGARSWHWVERLDTLISYQPDVVIQYNAINDIMWSYLEEYSKSHPNQKKFNKSLLYQKLFLINPKDFDNYFYYTLKQFFIMSTELKKRGIYYVAGSFPAPDYKLTEPSFHAFLDVNIGETWGVGLNLKYYDTYFRLIGRYNELFSFFVKKHNINHVMTHNITDPDLFTDICHMNQNGIQKLADAFLEPVIETIHKLTPPNRLN